MRKTFVVLLFVFVVVSKVEAQPRQMITQFLPHVVAGKFPHLEYDSIIEFKNSSSEPTVVTVEFFNTTGERQIVTTDKGMSDKFDFPIAGFGSMTARVLRQDGPFVTAWAKLESPTPFATFLTFRQFAPGADEPFSTATVFSSSPELVKVFDLKPTNGVALVNPGTADANIKVKALNSAGVVVAERSFVLRKGHHLAAYCGSEPFSFGNANGQMIVSSNVPLISLSLTATLNGMSTLPALPVPRRLNLEKIKISAVYVYSKDRQPQQDVAFKMGEGFFQYEFMMRNELTLNGQMEIIPPLPIKRDESGLPEVLVVQLLKTSGEYNDLSEVGQEVASYFSNTELNHGIKVIYYDLGKDFGNFCASSTGTSQYSASAWMNAKHLSFLATLNFGNATRQETQISPGVFAYGYSPQEEAEEAFRIFGHELEHCIGFNQHVQMSYLESDTAPFKTIMMGGSRFGCFGPRRDVQCVLSPMEASILPRQLVFNENAYGWTEWDRWSPPMPEIISKEWVGDHVRVVVRLKDNDRNIQNRVSGVHSVWLESSTAPQTHFWKMLGHTDNLEEFVIEADLPTWWKVFPGASISRISVHVMDYHGNTNSVDIF